MELFYPACSAVLKTQHQLLLAHSVFRDVRYLLIRGLKDESDVEEADIYSYELQLELARLRHACFGMLPFMNTS